MWRSNKLVLLALGVAILSGCSGGGEAPPPTTQNTVPELKELPRIAEATANSDIYLVRDDQKLELGERMDKAREVFAQPQGAYELIQLPAGYKGADYKARGWESPDQGFGVLLYKDRVALAMHQMTDVDESLVDEYLTRYKQAIPVDPELVESGPNVRYWFWERDGQRLMLAYVQTPTGRNLTLALGHSNLMDELRMSKTHAMIDSKLAERTLLERSREEDGS